MVPGRIAHHARRLVVHLHPSQQSGPMLSAYGALAAMASFASPQASCRRTNNVPRHAKPREQTPALIVAPENVSHVPTRPVNQPCEAVHGEDATDASTDRPGHSNRNFT